MANWRISATALLIAGAAALVLACGGGDSDDDDGQEPQATETMAADTEQPDDGDAGNGETDGDASGSGTAILTIGDETWSFEGIFCGFSPEETQNDRVSFTLSAFGEAGTGARIQLDATIQDTEEQGRYEGDGVIHSVSLDDIDDFENPSVSWSSVTGLVGEGGNFIQVDGKEVTAESTFDDGRTDEIEEVPGTLQASCP